MNRYLLLIISLLLLVTVSVLAQQPAANSQQNAEEPAVRITTNLVQIDVVVTNDKGQLVTDLQQDDFELYEDNRPQKITNFSFVPIAPIPQVSSYSSTPSTPSTPNKNNNLTPSTRFRPEKLHRTFALVVDNLNISYESVSRLKQALKRFVDEQMQPGDLVAILRTGSDVGSLQQFTSDKRLLYAAINNLRANFSPIAAGLAATSVQLDIQRASSAKSFSVGTLGALDVMVKGLRDLPGRKSVVIFSDGFPTFDRAAGAANARTDVYASIRRLADQANRASVVIYTIDTKGLSVGDEPADEPPVDFNPEPNTGLGTDPKLLAGNFAGLPISRYLADQTGGFSVLNNNDISFGITRVVNDQQGYYLLSYSPDELTFKTEKGRKFINVKVKVKRSGLKVRSRRGFLNQSDEAARVVARTPIEQLSNALVSPFTTSGVNLHITTFVVKNSSKPVIRSLIHIDGQSISFKEDGKGGYKGVIEILATTFGDNGVLVDKLLKEQVIEVRGQTYQRILRDGLISNINFPVKKSGAYQFRVAIRDAQGQNVGSANQFIEVPDTGKDRFGLSGLVLGNTDIIANSKEIEQISTALAPLPGQKRSVVEAEAELETILRRFHPGSTVKYSYQIYNINKQTQFAAQMRLLRDGQEIYISEFQPINGVQAKDSRAINAVGELNLDSKLKPGSYDLQINIMDRSDKNNIATQWIDFDVTE